MRLFAGACFPLLLILLAAFFETSMLPLRDAKGRENVSTTLRTDPFPTPLSIKPLNLLSLSLSLSTPIPPKQKP